MPLVAGKCTNFGLCGKADARERIDAALEDFVCPECGRPLEKAKASKPASSGRGLWIGLAAALTLVLAGGYYWWSSTCCAPPPPAPDPKNPDKPAASTTAWLRLAGSDTMASKLAPALIAAFQAKEPEKRDIQVAGVGSSTAFECLKQATCDIGMSSRSATPEEVSGLTEKVVALDAVTVIANASQPKTSLTEALASGLHWYTRNEASGTRVWFLVNVAPKVPDGAVTVATNAEMLAKVQADPQGLGYLSRAFVTPAVQELTPAGKPFTRDAIATESHPWARRLYFYLPSNPTPAAQRFTEFALSEAGQEAAENAGFVGQNIRMLSTVKAPETAPAEYQGVAAIAERLSFDIRFETNSSRLDSKARDDLDRIAKTLAQPALKDRKILLFGFADASGTRPANLSLSKERAKVVADALKQRSVTAALVTGFGQDLPVADNDTEANREKNRRVEVWLRR